MGIIAWIIVGGLAGWLAGLVVQEKRPRGCLMNVVVGIVGAVIGGAIFRMLGGSGVSGVNVWSIFVAFIGSVILLTVLNILAKR
jgi:uncharacterized membrane protein YeaQ/YmgE (transglycosylase-associated protein family)